MKTIRKPLRNLAYTTLALAVMQNSLALNVLMPIEETTQHLLQQNVGGEKANASWDIQPYDGSSLALVDDIRQQAIANTLPNAAQIPGATIQRWARLGFIQPIENQEILNTWQKALPYEVRSNISFQDSLYAVPTQIHRSNWMWVNKDRLNQFSQHEDIAPKNWESFIQIARKYHTAGSPFLLSVDDPAQNTLIFESLLLGLKGGDFYNRIFKDFNKDDLKSSDLIDVFRTFSELRPVLRDKSYPNWKEAIDALVRGDGVVLLGGDWIKPDLLNGDGQLPEQITCAPPPQAAATFLYSLNSVVFFKQTDTSAATHLSNVLYTESTQTVLNLQEGSIPVRMDISPTGFDQCGVRAMREFRSAAKTNTLRPSVAAGMAANELIQKAVFKTIDQFVNDWEMTPEDGAKQLSKAIRLALYRI